MCIFYISKIIYCALKILKWLTATKYIIRIVLRPVADTHGRSLGSIFFYLNFYLESSGLIQAFSDLKLVSNCLFDLTYYHSLRFMNIVYFLNSINMVMY